MSDDDTGRLGLPYLIAGQLQKHVTLNEALARLDALVQARAVSRTTASQPLTAEDGALYLLPAGASGADWAGQAQGVLMRRNGDGWEPLAAPDGMRLWIADEGCVVVRHGGAWRDLGGLLHAVQDIGRLGLNATADAANPFLAKLNTALWTALETGSGGTGDLRMTLNKAGPGNVLSLLFQSAWGGRAELGLIGDDRLSLKVSGDGATWRPVFSVDPTEGRASFERGASRCEQTIVAASGAYAVPIWARKLRITCIGGGGGGGAGAFGAASTARFGGGGGGAGAVTSQEFQAADLPNGLAVVVGAGGSGGVAAGGQNGGVTTVSAAGVTILSGFGGGGGAQGTAASGAGGTGGVGSPTANAGGQSILTGAGVVGRSYDRPDTAGGGGGGGAVDASNTARAGGQGGEGNVTGVRASGGAGGVGSAGVAGAASPNMTLSVLGSGGGGGGGASSGSGFAGGAGGGRSAGGGGGGAGLTAGGAGGAGAPGAVVIVALG